MEEKRYVAEIQVTDTPTRPLTDTEKQTIQEISVEKKSPEIKTIKNEKPQAEMSLSGGIRKGVSTSLALANVANSINNSIRTTNMDIRGDLHSSQQYKNNTNTIKETLNIATALGFGFAFGGLSGFGLAAGATLLSYTMKGVALYNETNKYMLDLEKDLRRSQYETNRQIKNISGGKR